jgi:hypothetical protein
MFWYFLVFLPIFVAQNMWTANLKEKIGWTSISPPQNNMFVYYFSRYVESCAIFCIRYHLKKISWKNTSIMVKTNNVLSVAVLQRHHFDVTAAQCSLFQASSGLSAAARLMAPQQRQTWHWGAVSLLSSMPDQQQQPW